jgi:hypothetical protein
MAASELAWLEAVAWIPVLVIVLALWLPAAAWRDVSERIREMRGRDHGRV